MGKEAAAGIVWQCLGEQGVENIGGQPTWTVWSVVELEVSPELGAGT